jgi:hypothetical protein
VCETKETPLIDDDRGCASSLRAILAFEEYIRKRAYRIGELLLIEVVRAGPGGMECDKFDREDSLPFRIDPPNGASEGVSWHLTLSYGGPLGDALGSRARWSDTGEAAAECVIDTLGLTEAQVSGRLACFFRDLADWLESEVRPRGLATEDRIKEGAGIARDLAERCRDLEGSLDLEGRKGGDRNLRS